MSIRLCDVKALFMRPGLEANPLSGQSPLIQVSLYTAIASSKKTLTQKGYLLSMHFRLWGVSE